MKKENNFFIIIHSDLPHLKAAGKLVSSFVALDTSMARRVNPHDLLKMRSCKAMSIAIIVILLLCCQTLLS
jgi:hypothetical protein